MAGSEGRAGADHAKQWTLANDVTASTSAAALRQMRSRETCDLRDHDRHERASFGRRGGVGGESVVGGVTRCCWLAVNASI